MDLPTQLIVNLLGQLQCLQQLDQLTGLANRQSYYQQLKSNVQCAQRQQQALAVMHINIDHFHHTNIVFGLERADQLLIDIAERIKSNLPPEVLLARIGSKEFAVILPQHTTQMALSELAEDVLQSLAQAFVFADKSRCFVGCSIGIISAQALETNADNLMLLAHQAMLKAKLQGRNNYRFAEVPQIAECQRQAGLEQGLRQALGRDELSLAYQPQIDLKTEQVKGYEVLARWQSPEYGYVEPAEFIPIAEDNGFIVPLGYWIIEQALRQSRIWQQQFPDLFADEILVSINFSPIQLLQPTMLQDFLAAITKHDINPPQVILELTETALLRDPERIRDILQQLVAKGVGVAIDDFGVGYSSLNHLKKLSVNWLKIDASFIRDMLKQPGDMAIVKSAIMLAKAFGLQVIAEGVESKAQKDVLQDLACDQVQGFYYSKPLNADDMTQYLQCALKK